MNFAALSVLLWCYAILINPTQWYLEGSWYTSYLCDPEDRGTMILKNVNDYLPTDTA